jgi:histone H4
MDSNSSIKVWTTGKLKRGIPKRYTTRSVRRPKISKNELKRLARRGGVKRISNTAYPELRIAMKEFLHTIIRDAVSYTAYSGRKTCKTIDVLQALKRNNKTLYGFQ